MDLHDHPQLQDTRRGDDIFVILSQSPSGASLEPLSQAHTFLHSDVIMLSFRRAFWTLRSDSITNVDDRDCTFADR